MNLKPIHPLASRRLTAPPVHTFNSSADFDAHEWDVDDLSRGKEPHLYSEDYSYDDHFGTVSVFGVEVSDAEHQRAVQYTVTCTAWDTLPTPPRMLEDALTWWNAPKADEDHIPSLPLRVDLRVVAELTECHVRLEGREWHVSAAYTCHYEIAD